MTDNNQGAEPNRPDPAKSTETLRTAGHDTKAALQGAAQDVADQIQHAGSQAKEKAADKVDAASDGAAEALRLISDQLKNAAEGLGGEQPWAEKAFRTGAQGLDRVTDYLATGKFDDFGRDVQTFARSNPAAFLAGGLALGFLAARVGKTAAHHAAETSSPERSETPAFEAPGSSPPGQASSEAFGGLR